MEHGHHAIHGIHEILLFVEFLGAISEGVMVANAGVDV
jgi:hypothetical protein